MKLVVLIPAFNEAGNIENAIHKIPKKISGIDKIEILVVDDGSTDNTFDVALNAGAHKVVSHKRNQGVGATFMTGIQNAISMGADVVVTFDADSQFDPKEISELIIPIINDQWDVVIGSRFLKEKPKDIPYSKFLGNKIFSKIVSLTVDKKFTDTQTGFRAYSREALLGISVVNEFTYTQEVLIDLKFKGFKIGEIPVTVTYDNKRKSRVVKNIFNYSYRAMSIIIRTFIYHRPILVLGLLGVILCAGGIIAKIITIIKVFSGGISVSLSSGLIILGIVSIMMGMFASVVFKRQAFIERDLRHYVDEMNKDKNYFSSYASSQ